MVDRSIVYNASILFYRALCVECVLYCTFVHVELWICDYCKSRRRVSVLYFVAMDLVRVRNLCETLVLHNNNRRYIFGSS